MTYGDIVWNHRWDLVYNAAFLAGGAVGGFIAAFRHPVENQIYLPWIGRSAAGGKEGPKIKIGFLGDVIVGVGAASAAYAFFSGMFPNVAEQSFIAMIKFAGWGIVAGYAGIAVLDKASAELFRAKAEELDDKTNRLNSKTTELEKQTKILKLVVESGNCLAKKAFARAVETSKEALALDPQNEDARMNLALALSYCDPGNYAEPIRLLDELIQRNPKNARAYYNRACIKALNLPKFPVGDVVADLQKAVAIEDDYKTLVAGDDDLGKNGKIKDLPEFKAFLAG